MLACEKGTVFVFLPEGEKWNIKESSDAPVSQEHSTIKRDVLSGSKIFHLLKNVCATERQLLN